MAERHLEPRHVQRLEQRGLMALDCAMTVAKTASQLGHNDPGEGQQAADMRRTADCTADPVGQIVTPRRLAENPVRLIDKPCPTCIGDRPRALADEYLQAEGGFGLRNQAAVTDRNQTVELAQSDPERLARSQCKTVSGESYPDPTDRSIG